VLLRTRTTTAAQWSFVDREEMLRSVVKGLPPKAAAKPE
jgi:hypothetical protein